MQFTCWLWSVCLVYIRSALTLFIHPGPHRINWNQFDLMSIGRRQTHTKSYWIRHVLTPVMISIDFWICRLIYSGTLRNQNQCIRDENYRYFNAFAVIFSHFLPFVLSFSYSASVCLIFFCSIHIIDRRQFQWSIKIEPSHHCHMDWEKKTAVYSMQMVNKY